MSIATQLPLNASDLVTDLSEAVRLMGRARSLVEPHATDVTGLRFHLQTLDDGVHGLERIAHHCGGATANPQEGPKR